MEVDPRSNKQTQRRWSGTLQGACKTVDTARNVPTAIIDNTPDTIDHDG